MDRFTEEKLKNKKYRNNEEAIRRAVFLTKHKLSVRCLIKTAHISRATLYRHHQNINEIIPDYENYVLKRFQSIVHFAKKKDIKLNLVYERLLLFILAHRVIILCIFKHCKNSNLIEKMIESLEPTIIATHTIKNDEVFKIYTKEVAYIIQSWQQDGFKKEEITVTLNKILYLTQTAQIRLSPIASIQH